MTQVHEIDRDFHALVADKYELSAGYMGGHAVLVEYLANHERTEINA
jgi:hypothetical protein